MKKFFAKLLSWIGKIILFFLILSIISVILFRFVPVPLTPLMVIRCTESLLDGKKMKLDKDWTTLEEISPNLQLAVICAEDQNFLNHFGFDLKAIEKAIRHNVKHKRIRGASTISQQTAKNVFLWPGRSWFRKGLETYFTGLIELFWSKKRIMEVYLNVIEMGDGIYGAEAASHHFFGKPAKKLNRGEAALIAAVLPNPIRWSAARPNGYVLSRQFFILQQMNQWGTLDYDGDSEGGFKK